MALNSLFCADVPLSNYSLTEAKFVRDTFRVYFNGVGQVPWQWKMI